MGVLVRPRRKLDLRRVEEMYRRLVGNLPPDLRRSAPRLVYRDYVARAGTYSPRHNEIRIDRRFLRLSPTIIWHILAHELAHYVLTKRYGARADLINRYHTRRFYEVLAEIGEYTSPEDARELDEIIRYKAVKLLGIREEKQKEKKKPKTEDLGIKVEPSVRHKGRIREVTAWIRIIVDSRKPEDYKRVMRAIARTVKKLGTASLTGCRIFEPERLAQSCIITFYTWRGNSLYDQVNKLKKILLETEAKVLRETKASIDIWRMRGMKSETLVSVGYWDLFE